MVQPGRRALLQFALLVPFAAPCQTRAAGPALCTPQDPILTLNNKLLVVMKAGKAVPFAERYTTLSRVVENTFDMPEILRRCVGPGWGTLPAREQAQLLEVFQRFTVASYKSPASTAMPVSVL